MFFLCDLWPLCDFRYDIDSKSPDLAKHVSEKPFFFFTLDQEFDYAFDPTMSLTACFHHVGFMQTKVYGT